MHIFHKPAFLVAASGQRRPIITIHGQQVVFALVISNESINIKEQGSQSSTSKSTPERRMLPKTTTSINIADFPSRLNDMLGEAERKGFENAVSWQPCGRAFRVHDTKFFAESIMPRYFNQTQYKSFQRQLNIYGFRRVTDAGSSKGGYTHDVFILGKPDICRFMLRTKFKTKGSTSDSCFGRTGKRKMVFLTPKPILPMKPTHS